MQASTLNKVKCFFCDNISNFNVDIRNTFDHFVDCPQCGKYQMSKEMFTDFGGNPKVDFDIHKTIQFYIGIDFKTFQDKKYIISHCIRKEYQNLSERVCINKDFLHVAIHLKELTIDEQLYAIITAIDEDSAKRGEQLKINNNQLAKYTALSQCSSQGQLKGYLQNLSEDGHIKYNKNLVRQKKIENGKIILYNKVSIVVKIQIQGLKFINEFKVKKNNSYEEALDMLYRFKDNIENKDCHHILYEARDDGARERSIGYLFKFMLHDSKFDINSETNNGRGPCDFKKSHGRDDATIVEFKLGRNFKDNIEEQVEIYKKASNAKNGISVIVCYTNAEIEKVKKYVQDKYQSEKIEHIISIDATKKVSASKV